MDSTHKVEEILGILQRKYLINRYRNSSPFFELIGTVLSHRTKDEVTWESAKKLLRIAPTPEKMLELSGREISKIIYPVGFYKQKAERIREICKIILKKYAGKVPDTREELMELPGVGGKTADIVLSHSFSQPVIAVDAHVVWVSNQLGWTVSKDPEKVREDLHKLIPPRLRSDVNSLLVQFGKDICNTGRPKCLKCMISKYCPNRRDNTNISYRSLTRKRKRRNERQG